MVGTSNKSDPEDLPLTWPNRVFFFAMFHHWEAYPETESGASFEKKGHETFWFQCLEKILEALVLAHPSFVQHEYPLVI